MKRESKDPITPDLLELLSMFLPAETTQHLNNARRELLLALRSWLDVYIEHLEVEMKEKSKATLRKLEVK